MLVLKFGGTSVGTPQRMEQVMHLIQTDPRPKVVVLSAVSGTTNNLVKYAGYWEKGDITSAKNLLEDLRMQYDQFIYNLLKDRALIHEAMTYVHEVWQKMGDVLSGPYSSAGEKWILAQGELISTFLFQLLLTQNNVRSRLLPALDFMFINDQGEPDMPRITAASQQVLAAHPGYPLYITQGYICTNPEGLTDNLKRGGSDYTATLLGAALLAPEVQIWTDIDGVHNNDPRIVEDTFPVRKLSYREAAELAYFGAKILHPTCVIPTEQTKVPLRLKNTMDPDAEGTLISEVPSQQSIAAIAAKDGQTVIKIYSLRMLMAYGFLRRVFEVFEKYQVPIDMITTSEVAVSLTIEQTPHLHPLVQELGQYGEVDYEADHSIICIVGHDLTNQPGIAAQVLSPLAHLPVRMVSYGGSRHNISILVPTVYKVEALQALNKALFQNHRRNPVVEC